MSQKNHFMQVALGEARRGIVNKEGGPFGACIVRKGKIIARAHNQVLKTNDPTQHAEVQAISQASRKLKTPHLRDCDIYSTTEPCPMCFSAIHWAKIRKVYYGTSIGDVARLGFNELSISNRQMKRMGGSHVKLANGMREDCMQLLKLWRKLPGQKIY